MSGTYLPQHMNFLAQCFNSFTAGYIAFNGGLKKAMLVVIRLN